LRARAREQSRVACIVRIALEAMGMFVLTASDGEKALE
jgi:hypothetical protein